MNRTNCSCGGGGGVGGGTTNGGGGGGTSNYAGGSSGGNGVRHLGPPAFLTKTFNIVDDSNTNSVISWSLSGDSFIIWNHLKFSAEILPIYFKHSNLASFVYQLNSYGFRKIGVAHQWEYENPNFQAGKRYLLANIRRRKRKTRVDNNNNNNNSGTELNIIRPEILMNEINESKLEIEKLQLQIKALQEKLENIYNETKKQIMHWAKALSWDEILGHEMIREETGKEKSSDDRDDDDQARKKRKLDTLTPENTKHELVKEGTTPLAKNRPVSSTDGVEVINGNLGEGSMATYGGDHYTFWKKIIMLEDDDEACESNGTVVEMGKKQAEIAMDLEGLIAKVEIDHDERVIIDLN